MLSNRLFMTALFNIASGNTVEPADFLPALSAECQVAGGRRDKAAFQTSLIGRPKGGYMELILCSKNISKLAPFGCSHPSLLS